ncbi:HamA C-terminal domain-containing protein [Acinetobacter ursingii]|uniref:HamA C-terminal domain-containing protein n=1 Tax=Acinetobacter ursingii TaxID=108980 RepID=UPI0032B3EB12
MTLATQLKNADDIKKILKKIPIDFELEDGRKINSLLVYLPCHADNQSSHEEFFECVREGILYNYVFSCTEVEKKLGVDSNDAKKEALFEKALRKISQQTAKGELGEMILFTILDVYLSAPKLLSKVAMKTNARMPVYGADAVHGQFIDGELRLYLGESKLHASFGGASTDAVQSISNARGDYQRELDLIDSHLDFPDLNESLANEILKILNPYETTNIIDKIHSPCFIGFTKPEILLSIESEYHKKYLEVADLYIKNFYSKAEKKGLDINSLTLLLLPFKCVQELTEEFISFFGISE